MREAFRRAATDKVNKNPNSPIVRVIRGVNRNQAAERIKQREQERFAKLREQFYDLGLMWFGTRVDKSNGIFYGHNRIPIEQKREKWTRALITLKDKPPKQRVELLGAMASGMQLTNERMPTPYRESVLKDIVYNPLSHLSAMMSGVNFTPQSMLFMDAISDMSCHSEEQKQEFRDFMVRKSGLTGKVELPQLFPAISQWLGHK